MPTGTREHISGYDQAFFRVDLDTTPLTPEVTDVDDPDSDLPLHPQDVEDHLEAAEIKGYIHRWMSRLPEQDMKIIEKLLAADFSKDSKTIIKSISRNLRIPETTVRDRLRLLKKHLKIELAQAFPERYSLFGRKDQ